MSASEAWEGSEDVYTCAVENFLKNQIEYADIILLKYSGAI